MDSILRFSNVVDNYVKYRPSYPNSILGFMEGELGFNSQSMIADIGSGTGKLSALFVENGNVTYGVEPNEPMRLAAESQFLDYSNFQSLDGSAENTSLEENSVDFVLVGQAFHWFDVAQFRKECKRILRPNGYVLLIWYKRLNEYSDFMRAYNDFLEIYAVDYQKINIGKIDQEAIQTFFGGNRFQQHNLKNIQYFDELGLQGRNFSCGYALPEDHLKYDVAKKRLQSIFHQYQVENQVEMHYQVEIYYGILN